MSGPGKLFNILVCPARTCPTDAACPCTQTGKFYTSNSGHCCCITLLLLGRPRMVAQHDCGIEIAIGKGIGICAFSRQRADIELRLSHARWLSWQTLLSILLSLCCLQLAAGQCNTFGTVEGNSAHPEGFCQLTCNHCNNYCVPKNGKSVPAAPTTPSGSSSVSSSSSSSSSGSCSDNPPSKQYSCAQQVRATYQAVCIRFMVSTFSLICHW